MGNIIITQGKLTYPNITYELATVTGAVKEWKQVHGSGKPSLEHLVPLRTIDSFAGSGTLITNCSSFTPTRIQGAQIWGGEILSDFNRVDAKHGGRGVECLGVFSDFTAKTYSAYDGDTAEKMKADGVRWTFGFVGCPIRRGKIQAMDGTGRFSDFENQRSARNVVGVDKSGRPLVLTVYGKTTEGTGVTLDELASLCDYLGFYEAANLDGGGSTQAMVKNHVYHPSSDPSLRRPIPTVMAITV